MSKDFNTIGLIQKVDLNIDWLHWWAVRFRW